MRTRSKPYYGLFLVLVSWLVVSCTSVVKDAGSNEYPEDKLPSDTVELTILVLKGTPYQSPGIPTEGVVEFTANNAVQQWKIPNGYDSNETTLFGKNVPSVDRLDIKLVEIAGEPVTDDKYSRTVRRIKIGDRKYFLVLYAWPK